MNVEDKLREELRRQDPPVGFAQRVSRLARRPSVPQRTPRLWWPAVSHATTIALVASLSVEYRNTQREQAARQTIEALKIASQELNIARDKVLNGDDLK